MLNLFRQLDQEFLQVALQKFFHLLFLNFLKNFLTEILIFHRQVNISNKTNF